MSRWKAREWILTLTLWLRFASVVLTRSCHAASPRRSASATAKVRAGPRVEGVGPAQRGGTPGAITTASADRPGAVAATLRTAPLHVHDASVRPAAARARSPARRG